MCVSGWPSIIERATKQAREWGFAPQDASDNDAGVHMLSRILRLKDSHPAEYVAVKMNDKWRPIIALCRDEKAERKEDAKIPSNIPPYRTCVQIQRCLGVPVGEAPQWYWTDGEDMD